MTSDEKRLADKAEAVSNAYKEVFESSAGEKVLEDLIRVTGLLGIDSGADPNIELFRKGQRFVGLHLMRMLYRDDSAIRKKLGEIYAR